MDPLEFANQGLDWVIPYLELPVTISYGTLILVAFLLFDATKYIQKQIDGESMTGYLVAGSIATALTVLSLVFHEAAHATACYVLGAGVSGSGISWWGAYVVPKMDWDKIAPLKACVIAFVGPATNIAIALIAMYWVKRLPESLTENTLQYTSYINFMLGKFNFLPLSVLDGGKALNGLLRAIFAQPTANWLSSAISYTVIAWWIFYRDPKRKSIENRLEKM